MGSKFGKTFKNLDIFGAPVGVNYRGDSDFKTNLGAFFSMIYFIAMWGFFVSQTIAVYNKWDPSSSTFRIKVDVGQEDTLNLRDEYWQVAFSFLNAATRQNAMIPPDIGQVKAK